MASLIPLPATAFVADTSPVVTGDNPAGFVQHKGRPAWTFDGGADEEAVKSAPVEMPSQYTGSGLTAKVHGASQNTTQAAVWDVRLEAVTPGTDTIDLSDTESFDGANTGTMDFAGTTAGDPQVVSVTLTNADSVAAGDLVRVLVRRATQDAADDASGNDAILYSVTLEDDG